MARKISDTTLKKQLKTWEKKSPEKFAEIKEYAEKHGLLTKTGKISTAKKNKKRLEKFKEGYKEKYGSYSSYEKERRERFNRYKEKHKDDSIKNSKEFEKLEKKVSSLYDEYRQHYNKDDPKSVDEFSLLYQLDLDEKIEYMSEMLEDSEDDFDILDDDELDELFSRGMK